MTTEVTATTVLIVDDDLLARRVLERRLADEGYQLAFAADGVEALAQAEAVRPDLILLDVTMPEMDGFEVCRRLRAHPELREVPVIMVTSLDDLDSRVQGLEAGADDFLSKSHDSAELKARVRTIARLNRYRRLLAERARFHWVVDQSEDGYLMVGPDDEIRYANLRAVDAIGRHGESFLAEATRRYRCVPEDAWARWPDVDGGPLFLVRPESRKEGALWLRVDVHRLPDAPDGALLVRLRDETAQMLLNRARWKLSTVLAQRLGSGLAVVLESLEMLATEAGRFSRAEVGQLAGLALRTGRRFERQARGMVEVLEEPDTARWEDGFAVAAVEGLVREIALEVGLELPVEVEVAPVVRHDRVPLGSVAVELIIREILENAKKFHPAGRPRVEVTVRRGAKGRVVLGMGDDGTAISADQIARAWIPFYLRHASDAGGGRTTGLGLSMVGHLVWGVGGTCRVRNREPGPGISVEVELPRLGEGGSD